MKASRLLFFLPFLVDMKCASDYRITLTFKLWLLSYKCSTGHTLARLACLYINITLSGMQKRSH